MFSIPRSLIGHNAARKLGLDSNWMTYWCSAGSTDGGSTSLPGGSRFAEG